VKLLFKGRRSYGDWLFPFPEVPMDDRTNAKNHSTVTPPRTKRIHPYSLRYVVRMSRYAALAHLVQNAGAERPRKPLTNQPVARPRLENQAIAFAGTLENPTTPRKPAQRHGCAGRRDAFATLPWTCKLGREKQKTIEGKKFVTEN